MFAAAPPWSLRHSEWTLLLGQPLQNAKVDAHRSLAVDLMEFVRFSNRADQVVTACQRRALHAIPDMLRSAIIAAGYQAPWRAGATALVPGG